MAETNGVKTYKIAARSMIHIDPWKLDKLGCSYFKSSPVPIHTCSLRPRTRRLSPTLMSFLASELKDSRSVLNVESLDVAGLAIFQVTSFLALENHFCTTKFLEDFRGSNRSSSLQSVLTYQFLSFPVKLSTNALFRAMKNTQKRILPKTRI